MRQEIADLRPAWTMDYIDRLSWREVEDLFAYEDGKGRAREINT